MLTESVACLKDVTLATAILSSLATLGKYISASYSTYLDVSNARTGIAVKIMITKYIPKLLQLLVKYAALGCTAYFTIHQYHNTEQDPCGNTAAVGLIYAVISLKFVSSISETAVIISDSCRSCKKCQLKERDEAGARTVTI